MSSLMLTLLTEASVYANYAICIFWKKVEYIPIYFSMTPVYSSYYHRFFYKINSMAA